MLAISTFAGSSRIRLNLFADLRGAGLLVENHCLTFRPQPLDQKSHLRALSAAFGAFKRDEAGPRLVIDEVQQRFQILPSFTTRLLVVLP